MQVLRRKIAQARIAQAGTRNGVAEPVGGAERAFRLALARAARDAIGLALDVTRSSQDRLTLSELVDMPPDRALMVMLDQNGGDGLGLIVLSPAILSGLVEMLTTGRVSTAPPPTRRPTRTDGAMLAALIDGALSGLDSALQDDSDRLWAAGWRYASFVDDARTLGLLLEDAPYQVIRADVSLMDGAKSGPMMLALPDRAAAAGNTPEPAPATDHSFSAHLAAQVDTVTARLDAVVGRLTLPLARLSTLLPGETLPLPLAGIDRVRLVGLDGRLVGEGRLGQAHGLRAIRLTTDTRSDAEKAATPDKTAPDKTASQDAAPAPVRPPATLHPAPRLAAG